MKKTISTLITAAIIGLIFVSCKIEDSSSAVFIYKNNTSNDIEMRFFKTSSLDNPNKQLIINPGEEEKLVFTALGAENKFNPIQDRFSRITISNGVVIVTEERLYDGLNHKLTLFDFDSYEAQYSDKTGSVWTYTYVFTDDYFADGEPIE